ncbi:MAG: DUF4079 family protein [Myxococcota bacterium]
MESWQRILAFAHPAWMVVSVVLAIQAGRLGTEIRRRRAKGQRVERALRDRHLRFGQIAIAMVVVGFVGGPPSMFFFRERAVFESFHAILGLIVLGLFLWTGWSGRALANGDASARDIHRIAAGSAIAAALASSIAGFTLLP